MQLKKFSALWKGKDVLDISAGSGWLVNELIKSDANYVVGSEASQHCRELGSKKFPHIKLEEFSLQDYPTEESFDVIFCIFVLSHLEDLNAAYEKLSSLLRPGGELFIVDLDYDNYDTQRKGYVIERVDLNDDEYVIAIERPTTGRMVDIVRRKTLHACLAERIIFLLKMRRLYLETNQVKVKLKRNPIIT